MQVHTLTNQGIFERDWAAENRQNFLRTMPTALQVGRSSASAKQMVAICGTDVSGSDSRSVKAYLNGRGDLRAGWWILYSTIYLLATRRGTEHAMFSFHSFHHALTLRCIEFLGRRRQVASDLRAGGILAALRNYR